MDKLKKVKKRLLSSATLLSVYLLNASLKFLSKKDRDQNSKKLFFVTIIYLPLLLASLVIDRYL